MTPEFRRSPNFHREIPSPQQIELGSQIKAWAEEIMGDRKKNVRKTEEETFFFITKQIALEKIPGSQLRHEVYQPHIGQQATHVDEHGRTVTANTTYMFDEDGFVYKLGSQTITKQSGSIHELSYGPVEHGNLDEEELKKLLNDLQGSQPYSLLLKLH